MPIFDIVGHFPPWYDWLLFLISTTLFITVLVVGVIDSRNCREEWAEKCQWSQGFLYPGTMSLALVFNTLNFWLGYERSGLTYVGVLTLFFVTSVASFIGFAYMRFCTHPTE